MNCFLILNQIIYFGVVGRMNDTEGGGDGGARVDRPTTMPKAKAHYRAKGESLWSFPRHSTRRGSGMSGVSILRTWLQ